MPFCVHLVVLSEVHAVSIAGNSNAATCMKDVPMALREADKKRRALEEQSLEAWDGLFFDGASSLFEKLC